MRAPRRLLAAGLIALAAGWIAPSPGPAHSAEESPDALPAGQGRDETFYACTGCHGTALVTAQGMTRGQWDSTIDWMVERHGMPELDAAERALVLGYLATQFPPRQRGRANPFLNR